MHAKSAPFTIRKLERKAVDGSFCFRLTSELNTHTHSPHARHASHTHRPRHPYRDRRPRSAQFALAAPRQNLVWLTAILALTASLSLAVPVPRCSGPAASR